MITIEAWFAFVMACLVFSSVPGIGILTTVNHAITTNMRYTAFSIVGLELALAIYVLVVSVGLSVILAESLLLFTIVKWCGAGYLIWLGIQQLMTRRTLHGSSYTQSLDSWQKAIKTGVMVNFSNPKSIIFLAAFFPQFINPNESVIGQYLIFGITMVVIDTLFHTFYAVFAASAKKYIVNKRSSFIVNKIFGILFIGAGILMARSDRTSV